MLDRLLAAEPVTDMHTHLYPPAFGTPVAHAVRGAAGRTDPAGLMLWGVDELVTYHYLVAEVFRAVPASTLPYADFWRMTKPQQADHVWRELFVNRTPLSEACRGVLTTLQKLGLDPNETSLDAYRPWFAAQDPDRYVDRVMELSNVASITMTNNVFDENERTRWLADPDVGTDPRFTAVLRIDPLLLDWPASAAKLAAWGYRVTADPTDATVEEVRRFLRDWIDRQKAIYLAVSLPPAFRSPADPADPLAVAGQAILDRAVLPVCAERGLPFAMMIGATRAANPALRDGGDMLGLADVQAVVRLCREFPANRFFVTMLARENQHELCVAARKFGNLMPFGCWWFLNDPSLIREITTMRVELLGTGFIPQHSDARVLDQLLYKWDHSRCVIAGVLAEKYGDLIDTGRRVTEADVGRDVKRFLSGNFAEFLTPTNAVETPTPALSPVVPNGKGLG